MNGEGMDTITVTVKVFGAHRERFGSEPRQIEIPKNGTLRDLLAYLHGVAPQLGPKLEEGLSQGYLHVLVNGRNAQFLEQLATVLKQDDTVAFLPPIGGG